ncbi:cysteine dioxygenase family protein [Streptomyces fradiae]|uniref:cysteine dioxygenase n=1 Tax=Streptomyces fradiae TaxID=1906 RepID=UPI0033E9353C
MNSDSDLQIAGDILAVQHLLQPAREHPATVAEFAGLARSIAADRRLWAPLVSYDATTRWYHRLRTGPGYEVWLLSWLPGQGTGPHDHGGSTGYFTVLEGELTERTEAGARTLTAGARTTSAKAPARAGGARGASGAGAGTGAGQGADAAAGAGAVSGRVVAPGRVHELVNDSLEPAVSLHVYFPGLTDMPMHAATGVVHRFAPSARSAVRA